MKTQLKLTVELTVAKLVQFEKMCLHMSNKTMDDDVEKQQKQLQLDNENDEKKQYYHSKMLLVSFIAMIVIGLGNKIFQKLQTLPMHNYPFFLNLMSTFVYIPISFIYILPMQYYGKAITKECREIPQWKFIVMGTLDGIGGILGTFAVNYISNSSMIILLTQASIPISMALSKVLY